MGGTAASLWARQKLLQVKSAKFEADLGSNENKCEAETNERRLERKRRTS